MNLDKLKSRWQVDAPDGWIADRSEAEMLERVKLQSDRFDRRLRRRDWLETVAAGLVSALLFAGMPSHGWLARAGMGIVILACIFIVWRLHATRNRHAGTSMDRPVSDVLRGELAKLDDQLRLVEGVLWWYLAPLGVGLVLAVAGVRGWSWFTIWFALGYMGLGAGIHYLNRSAARRELRPRRQELLSMLAAVEGEADAGLKEHDDD